jgi:hypothetical protein
MTEPVTFSSDGAAAQSAVWSTCTVFGGKIISMGLWPPCLPELNPHDLYWWGLLRDKVYSSNPHTEDSSGIKMYSFQLDQQNFDL